MRNSFQCHFIRASEPHHSILLPPIIHHVLSLLLPCDHKILALLSTESWGRFLALERHPTRLKLDHRCTLIKSVAVEHKLPATGRQVVGLHHQCEDRQHTKNTPQWNPQKTCYAKSILLLFYFHYSSFSRSLLQTLSLSPISLFKRNSVL